MTHFRFSPFKILAPALLLLSPGFVFSQDYTDLIKKHLQSTRVERFKKQGLTDFKVDNADPSASLNGTVLKIQQIYKGYPVFNAVSTAVVKDNKILYFSDSFIKDYKTVSGSEPVLENRKVFSRIASTLGIHSLQNISIKDKSSQSSHSEHEVEQSVFYFSDTSGLRLAYEFSFHEPRTGNYWNIIADAHTGEILSKQNLTLSCHFNADAYASDHLHSDTSNNLYSTTSIKSGLKLADDASYNVFPLPVESPSFGNRAQISNPWILAASPEGWHSTGNEKFSITRGNNVFAYEDTADQNVPGFSPDGGANRNFNFPFALNASPAANQAAAITNLFYVTNRVHDVFYQLGFTESARNFQQNNFGKGGVGGDFLLAESQDGGGVSNANFTTRAEGKNPTMQMYLWSPVNRYFFYNAPVGAITRVPQASPAQFGPPLNGLGVTADVALANVIDGCTALTPNSLAGKIGLVERGGSSNCTFAVKVKNAQDAGAVAAIIYNQASATNFPASMGGTDATITIPSVLISNSEGEYIKTQLNNSLTVNVTLKSDPATAVTPDGSFDNGIITHEYGHGISTRLTGNGYSCLNEKINKEQMGEGWSDFFALMLTNRPDATPAVARSIGTYASGQNASGAGFRPAKYSPDFTVNNYTYGDTNGMEYDDEGEIVPDVHQIGFVWASMLWDLHWQYAAKYGFSSDISANPNSGSARIVQIVTDALKLQVCNPTFTDGRNAILAAETLITGGTDRCMIWNTFARRGLGLNSTAGSKDNINDQLEDFSVPKDCAGGGSTDPVNLNSLIKIHPNPAKDDFFIYIKDQVIGKVFLQIYDMSGKLVVSENLYSPESRIRVSLKDVENGVYVVKLNGAGIDWSAKLMVRK